MVEIPAELQRRFNDRVHVLDELEKRLNGTAQPEKEDEGIFGRALLQKDKLSGKKYWSTWNGEGKHEIVFSAGQALTFPPDELQIGTRIHLIAPKVEE